jgi:uracil-DNA glycosylase
MNKTELDEIISHAEQKYDEGIVYPSKENVFRAINELKLKEVKVVIFGQDPYHQPNQANGLAFSVGDGIKLPPSLRNIFKELETDIGVRNETGDLSRWVNQGVLLLNTSLTVFEGKPKSHDEIGWEKVTDSIIKVLNSSEQPMVFILWGNDAKKKKKLLTKTNCLIIESPHPSPLSSYRGFFGSTPFSKTNQYLKEHKIKIIDWKLGEKDV